MQPTKSRRATAAALAAVLVVSLAGAAAADTFKIKAKDTNKWGPVHTYIGKGDKVVWRNPTIMVHDVKSIGSKWSFAKTLDPGTGVSRVFKNTGTYRFRCARHSAMVDGKCQGMCGIVHVFNN